MVHLCPPPLRPTTSQCQHSCDPIVGTPGLSAEESICHLSGRGDGAEYLQLLEMFILELHRTRHEVPEMSHRHSWVIQQRFLVISCHFSSCAIITALIAFSLNRSNILGRGTPGCGMCCQHQLLACQTWPAKTSRHSKA